MRSWFKKKFSLGKSGKPYVLSSGLKKYLKKHRYNHPNEEIAITVEKISTICIDLHDVLSMTSLIKKSQLTNPFRKNFTIASYLAAHQPGQDPVHDAFFNHRTKTNAVLELKINGYIQFVPIFNSPRLRNDFLRWKYYRQHEMALEWMKFLNLKKLEKELEVVGFTVVNSLDVEDKQLPVVVAVLKCGSQSKLLQKIQRLGFMKDPLNVSETTFYFPTCFTFDKNTKVLSARNKKLGYVPEHAYVLNLMEKINNFYETN